METLVRRRGQPYVTNQNTPRSIRTRLAAPRRRAEPTADAAPAPDSPSQLVARSAAGKTALGPWMGSFGGVGDAVLEGEPTSPTFFATSQGAVFADLQGSPVTSYDMSADAEVAVAAAAGDAPAHTERDVRLARRAVRDEMGVLRRKAEGARRVRAGAAGLRPNALRRRMRTIGQARKQN